MSRRKGSFDPGSLPSCWPCSPRHQRRGCSHATAPRKPACACPVSSPPLPEAGPVWPRTATGRAPAAERSSRDIVTFTRRLPPCSHGNLAARRSLERATRWPLGTPCPPLRTGASTVVPVSVLPLQDVSRGAGNSSLVCGLRSCTQRTTSRKPQLHLDWIRITRSWTSSLSRLPRWDEIRGLGNADCGEEGGHTALPLLPRTGGVSFSSLGPGLAGGCLRPQNVDKVWWLISEAGP